MATKFTNIYNRFLKQITDDLYVELTPDDTIRDLRDILEEALPRFEFPRSNILDYTISSEIIDEENATNDDFIIGIVEPEDSSDEEISTKVLVERSEFNCDLIPEEEMIIALLMMDIWLQRQVTSIENTRMKYSGSDFKMTSQANHLSKLVALLERVKQTAHHYQRLYKRRRLTDENVYRSNWDVFGVSALDD